jgi:predicted phosphohydrolase
MAALVRPRDSEALDSTVPRTLAWATDIHLDHLQDAGAIAAFARTLIEHDPDAVLITGDITVARRLEVDLTALAAFVGRPLYLTLGNHDFYGATIDSVRAEILQLCAKQELLHYLPEAGVVRLSETTALVGVDGWGDARCGDWRGSKVRLSDFVLIQDLAQREHGQLVETLRALGDAEAERARGLLERALPECRRLLFATHVPPFEEACWNEGELPGPDDPWSPWFVCVAVGEVLLEFAERFPERHIEVYCGHTHGSGTARIRNNLHVITGEVEYGAPQLARLLEID